MGPGIPGLIVRIEDHINRIATVSVCGVRRRIDISCIVNEAHPVDRCVGEWILLHAGFALSRTDELHAKEMLQILEELVDMQEELRATTQPASVEVA